MKILTWALSGLGVGAMARLMWDRLDGYERAMWRDRLILWLCIPAFFMALHQLAGMLAT